MAGKVTVIVSVSIMTYAALVMTIMVETVTAVIVSVSIMSFTAVVITIMVVTMTVGPSTLTLHMR